jgi:carboxymethylenebutenolidase
MPETTDEEVRFPGNGGDEIAGYLARPAAGGPWPGVVVVHEIFGMTDHLRDVARRFAAEGFAALVPDLWSREGGTKGETDLVKLRAFVETIPDARMVGDLAAAARWLGIQPGVRPGVVGTVGFCMGGIYAFHLACVPGAVKACVDFYGRLVYPHPTPTKPRGNLERVGELKCPLLGIFGGLDDLIPLAQVLELKSKLRPGSAVLAYPKAGHAFFNDTRTHFRPEEAADAWRRTLAFLRQHLAPDLLPPDAEPAVPELPEKKAGKGEAWRGRKHGGGGGWHGPPGGGRGADGGRRPNRANRAPRGR